MANSSHDAPGQMHGYLYQLERALFQLSQTKPGGFVGIETGDDVVTKSSDEPDAEQLLEQDKHSTSKTIPFSDLSKDLWNTLLIWTSGITSGKINLEKSAFLMVSNKKLPSGRFVWKINAVSNKESGLDCARQLRELGLKHNGKLKPTIDHVLALADEELAEILVKIHVLDIETTHDRNTFKKDIRSNLGLGDDIPFHETYQYLMGWLFDTVMDCWEKEKEAWMPVEALFDKRNHLIQRYLKKPFIERAVDSIPIKGFQREAQQKEDFVKQLKLIDCNDGDVLDAIDNFLRASTERTRYAEEARVSNQDFVEFERNLVERWKNIFGSEADEYRPTVSGRKVYFKTTNHKEKLMGVETEQYYTTKGAYQRLSNNSELGWHPGWEDLMNK